MPKSNNLVIVSNRLPISVKKNGNKLEFHDSIGGLATGLSGCIKNNRNIWVGWPGIASDLLTAKQKAEIRSKLLERNCYPVFLSNAQLDGFYSGYSNRVLWPLFHNRKILPITASQQKYFWNTYKEVNKLYAKTIIDLCQVDSTIWIHDYHLLLTPDLLRKMNHKGKIGFFLHIPFPSPKKFVNIKYAREIMIGLLGADLIGCHIKRYCHDLLESCRILELGHVVQDKVAFRDHSVRVTNFPMSIDYDKFVKIGNSINVKEELSKLRLKHHDKKIILAVDRLDPTKGLVGRVEAYQKLILNDSSLRGRVVMIMLAVPSRTELREYMKTKTELEALISQINNMVQTDSWRPIEYIYSSVSFEELAALYKLADIAFIAPLIDGMNLVAKEYVACKTDSTGVLILSGTAGAAEELGGAIIVDPSDTDDLAIGLNEAISMSGPEARRRMRVMQEYLSNHTVKEWTDSYLTSLLQ